LANSEILLPAAEASLLFASSLDARHVVRILKDVRKLFSSAVGIADEPQSPCSQ
jgi:hypothetical protein